jgi:hypothetical protein
MGKLNNRRSLRNMLNGTSVSLLVDDIKDRAVIKSAEELRE